MALLSSGGGDDRLQISTAVFAVVISLVITMMIPIVAPSYDTGTGYSYESIYAEKSSLVAYTGESMTNQTPFVLTAVYTPYAYGGDINVDAAGWLYGESINYSRAGEMGTTAIGSTNSIYLDPAFRSSTPLMPSIQNVPTEQSNPAWWATGADGNLNLFGSFIEWIGHSEWVWQQSTVPTDYSEWTFTGYRYVFDPMLYLDYADPAASPYDTPSQQDATLSVVWYKTLTSQGLSSGLVLYNDKTQGMVANYDVSDLISNYNGQSSYSTKYALNFNGAVIYLNLKFDPSVIADGVDLATAFDDGQWSMAVTAPSMDTFMNIRDSGSLSNAAGNILDTYIEIFTFDMPNLPFVWSMVLWILCILPVDLVVLMFLSRFGIAGLGVGILGNVLLGVLA